MKGIKDYFENEHSSTLRRVCVVGPGGNTVNTFHIAMRKIFKKREEAELQRSQTTTVCCENEKTKRSGSLRISAAYHLATRTVR